MKKIIKISGLFFLVLGLFACHNKDWSFPDFDYTTTYFPNQYPVRTLVFGDYVYDNSGDNDLQFLISATMGGVYQNKKDIKVEFVVDNTLADSLYTNTGTKIHAIPVDWYTLSGSEITIPNGNFAGGVTVQLKNNFLTDSNSIRPYWVIPLKITSATTDSVLQGKPAPNTPNPDPRIAGNWTLVPKDFTIFGVKYVNEWHGKYLLRGTDVVTAPSGVLETINYRTQFLEGNQVVSVLTSGRNQVKFSNSIRRAQSKGGSPGSFEMKIDFNPTDITQATLTTTTRYPKFPVNGTVKMARGAESWNNIDRDVIYLDYQIHVADTIHYCKDTLVFRDKAVKYEEFVPVVRK